MNKPQSNGEEYNYWISAEGWKNKRLNGAILLEYITRKWTILISAVYSDSINDLINEFIIESNLLVEYKVCDTYLLSDNFCYWNHFLITNISYIVATT